MLSSVGFSPFNDLIICLAIALARRGGTALPV